MIGEKSGTRGSSSQREDLLRPRGLLFGVFFVLRAEAEAASREIARLGVPNEVIQIR